MDAMPYDLYSENGSVCMQIMAGCLGTYDRCSQRHDICEHCFMGNHMYRAHSRGTEQS